MGIVIILIQNCFAFFILYKVFQPNPLAYLHGSILCFHAVCLRSNADLNHVCLNSGCRIYCADRNRTRLFQSYLAILINGRNAAALCITNFLNFFFTGIRIIAIIDIILEIVCDLRLCITLL